MAGKSGNFGQCIKNLKCFFEIFLLNAYCALILRKNHANRLIAWFFSIITICLLSEIRWATYP